MSVVADPSPTTTGDGLRERIEALEHDVFAALRPYQEPSTRDLRNDPLSRKRRVTERDRWFEHAVRRERREHGRRGRPERAQPTGVHQLVPIRNDR